MIAPYLESLGHPRRFARIARRVARHHEASRSSPVPERLATAYRGDRGELQTVTRAELQRAARRHRDVVVLVVRPGNGYRDGHLAGAIWGADHRTTA